MAVKAGQILHTGNGFLVDRIQSAGVGSVNVNTERIEELGNYNAIATLRDTPDLSFEMETFDMSTELHELLFGALPGDAAGTIYSPEIDLRPIDVTSPFKGKGTFDVVRSLAIPYLDVESMAWSFSVDNPASLTVGLRGDSIFYIPGDVYREQFDGVPTALTFGGGTGGVAGPVLKTVIDGVDRFALGVMQYTDATGTFRRLRLGVDYTETSTVVTLLVAPAAADSTWVTYGHATLSTYGSGVHKAVATATPAAVKGRNIEVSIAGSEWFGIQTASVEWRATLERDEELNNPNIVSQDFDVPDVTGTISMKPATAAALFDQILDVAGITSPDIVNAVVDPPQLDLRFLIKSPTDGSIIQTLQVPDAQFDPQAWSGQVGNKLEVDFPFTSAGGDLNIHKGDVV